MKIKVCGLKYIGNIRLLWQQKPDYMGFIFYSSSKRYAGEKLDHDLLNDFPPEIQKIGVFVNESMDKILKTAEANKLQGVQLHDDETPEICFQLKNKGLTVIKAFKITENFDFSLINQYKSSCHYFLFDSPAENFGGSGNKFDWNILASYDNEIPFFLSGGIGPEDVQSIKNLSNLNIHAVDINSKFEITIGLKNADKVRYFINELNK